MEITWKKFFQICRKKIWVIILCTVLAALGGGLVAKYAIPKTYTSTLVMLVRIDSDATAGSSDVNGNFTTTVKILKNCVEIINQPQYFRKIAENAEVAKHDFDEREVGKSVSYSVTTESSIITARVTTKNSAASLAIAAAIRDTAVPYIVEMYDVDGLGVSVINDPQLADRPDKSSTLTYAVICGLAGLILSVLVVLLVYVFDTRIKSREDLAGRYELPVLGVIPKNSAVEAEPKRLRLRKKNVPELRTDFLLDDKSNFFLLESFRNLMAGVGFSVLKQEGFATVLSVTSSNAMEGKSVITANLAWTCAQAGKRVLIIDCDLRKSRQNQFFGNVTTNGLSKYLCGQCELEDVIAHTEYNRLDAIFAGIAPPNPIELLQNGRFRQLLDDVKLKYDMVLIDTPPIDVVSDALIVIPMTDGVLYVVTEKSSTHSGLQRGLEQLAFAKIKVLGFVLNRDEEEYEIKKYGKISKYSHYNGYYASTGQQEGSDEK